MRRSVLALASILAALFAATPVGQAPETGVIAGHVKLTTRIKGRALPSTAYPTRAVGAADPTAIPEIKNGGAMTMAGVEGEWAFAGTKVSGEVLRTAFETRGDTSVAYEWFVQGLQTSSPRWFVAARREGTSAPPLVGGTPVGSRSDLDVFEATAGFRPNRDITLRSSYYTRRVYGATDWTNQAGVAVVWTRRWW
jgi:hypothetical protein